jgi:hypothetical protein
LYYKDSYLWSWALLEKLPIMQPLKSLPLVPILSQIDPVHTIPSLQDLFIYCSATYFLPSYWLLCFWLSHQYSIWIPLVPHSCYMPCPFHPWLDHSVWQEVQVMKLLIMQFSPISHHFISLQTKYSSQHPDYKYSPKTIFSLACWMLSTVIGNFSYMSQCI